MSGNVNIHSKIFEDFPSNSCDGCERWWNNQCDGRSINENASNRPCIEFLPTRNIEIPQRIKTLENGVKRLEWVVLILAIALLINSLKTFFW